MMCDKIHDPPYKLIGLELYNNVSYWVLYVYCMCDV